MRVKRYVVDTMPDALQKIRTDLGKDAVILNTKEVRSGGFMGLFSKKKIEVIAATDTAPSDIPSGTPAPKAAPAPQAVAASPASSLPRAALQAAAAAYSVNREEKLTFPDVPDVLPPEPKPSVRPAPQAAIVKGREDILLEELQQMKEMMNKLAKHQLQAAPADPVVERMEARLHEQELDPSIIEELLAGMSEEAEAGGQPMTEPFASASVRRQLKEILFAGKPKSISKDTRIAHFVGPTGVGKTTTIAKLAAEQVLRHQRKVGFITSDTYRIAAVEQLRTYATILNVPLEVVFSPLDLGKAFEQLKDCDLIFMDTAGRNFRNEMYVSELNALLQSRGQSETFLVLSLTTKYKDMRAITNNFNKFKLDKVLFTKMDETESYGAIVNLIREFGLQTSYITDGQGVPDDIAELDESRLIDLILEDSSS
ncbi:flagellar biosynthesis protein FlhF [Paenibacillus filicis]|uniref:Flagellar biosynthesis protein FlhF n=1 Tax=Paenibacillus gyeongsangnamensis TaxID=3388067 RepID=A0ABT4Q6B3_9BACL|nr:flagellar biosynthesis protein FlhF [Paenibacillus filicis]MCZ8512353.1 flagellar biosynthesis protein FlhF [Paenibacillus filicis]